MQPTHLVPPNEDRLLRKKSCHLGTKLNANQYLFGTIWPRITNRQNNHLLQKVIIVLRGKCTANNLSLHFITTTYILIRSKSWRRESSIQAAIYHLKISTCCHLVMSKTTTSLPSRWPNSFPKAIRYSAKILQTPFAISTHLIHLRWAAIMAPTP